MNVTAMAQRTGSWWAIEVPEYPGVFTQARRLDLVPAMVRDAVAAMTGIDSSDIVVQVVPLVPDMDEVVRDAREAKAAAEVAQAAASEKLRSAARRLVERDLTVRDAGELLGVSPQRISQLVKG